VLAEPQVRRFSRHVLLREVGGRGQERLLSSCVRVPSLDESGRACALWLARAGVGALELPDDLSPAPASDGSGLLLASDAGRPLADAVRERLRFHQPGLAFRGGASLEAHAGGASAALDVVRKLVAGQG
jgi:molybdopterin-synthase adenylyltransferase